MSGVGYFAGSTLAGAWGGESPHSNSFVCSEYMAGCGGTSLGKQRYQIGMFFDESIHTTLPTYLQGSCHETSKH